MVRLPKKKSERAPALNPAPCTLKVWAHEALLSLCLYELAFQTRLNVVYYAPICLDGAGCRRGVVEGFYTGVFL